jgi:7 transmembrane receptor (Secretin family).
VLSPYNNKPLRSFFQNGPYCKIILLLTKYFRLTNYMWMFCEGFYLHRLISTAFAEEKGLALFYVIGWGEYNSFYRNGSFTLIDDLFAIYVPSIAN